MRTTIFLFSTLIAIILATTITIWYIDTKCNKTKETTVTLQPSESTIFVVNECGDTIKTSKGITKIDTNNFKNR